MVKIKQGTAYKYIIGFLLSIGLVVGVYAIDNPEAPDLIGEFEKREIIYLTAIDRPQNSTRDFLVSYDNYLIFLDEELNKAADKLNSKLPEARKLELMAAQQHWSKYRDAEFEFIKNTWTRKGFGSSAGISRGDYRTSIIKDRVIQLLHYTKNF
ncbi:lysozyme inhibitor LprI family protein [Teredinibacter haidensis]|uniref:lysozyme inhibitor LprI family protein n=1 Tax=Teredinibacter haidensis TaxID=2731755 RepID=UPI000949129A|nr:lysozyme inhibitor LprI family protein [Teredinibacter haidensis]